MARSSPLPRRNPPGGLRLLAWRATPVPADHCLIRRWVPQPPHRGDADPRPAWLGRDAQPRPLPLSPARLGTRPEGDPPPTPPRLGTGQPHHDPLGFTRSIRQRPRLPGQPLPLRAPAPVPCPRRLLLLSRRSL